MISTFYIGFILLVNSILGIPFEKARESVLQDLRAKKMGTPNPDFRQSKRTYNFLDVEVFGEYSPALYVFFDKGKFYRLYFEFAVPASSKKNLKETLSDSIRNRFPNLDVKGPFYFVSKDGLHHIQITEESTGIIILNDWYGPMWKPQTRQQFPQSLTDAWEKYKNSR